MNNNNKNDKVFKNDSRNKNVKAHTNKYKNSKEYKNANKNNNKTVDNNEGHLNQTQSTILKQNITINTNKSRKCIIFFICMLVFTVILFPISMILLVNNGINQIKNISAVENENK